MKLSPGLAAAYYNRGLAKQNKGDLNGAFADYNQAIKLDAKNAIAYNNRAMSSKGRSI
jgi:Flp pilus assembly protein TadD